MAKKVAIVTGGAKGIGACIVRKLCEDGYKVVLNYKNSKKEATDLCKLLTEKNCKVEKFQADVADYKQVKKLFEFTNNTFGEADVLVNNAGVSDYRLFNEITADDWDKVLRNNLSSVLNCSHCAVKSMLKAHSGNIVNISSIWGIVGAAMEVIYSTSKAAIIGFTKSLAKEVAPNGVRVNCIAPGVIDTDMMKDFSNNEIDDICSDIPMGRLGSGEDIADLVSFLVSEKAGYITGQIISPNGGYVV